MMFTLKCKVDISSVGKAIACIFLNTHYRFFCILRIAHHSKVFPIYLFISKWI